MGKKSKDKVKSNKLGSHIKPKTRKFFVSFKGSLNDLACEPCLRNWKVMNPVQVFGAQDQYDNDNDDDDHHTDDGDVDDDEHDENTPVDIAASASDAFQKSLENGLLISAKIKKIQSNFPCDIAINLNYGRKSSQYSFADGQRCHYVAFPNEVNHMLNEDIVHPDYKALNTSYLKKHSKYLPNRLLDDVSPIAGRPYSLVHADNPIIKFIKANEDDLHMRLTANDLMDGNLYKIKNDHLKNITELIKTQLHETLPIVDLSNLSVSISRLGDHAFDDPRGVADNLTSPEAVAKTMNMKRSLNCVVEIEYALV